jgi:formate C-acetyltransferase
MAIIATEIIEDPSLRQFDLDSIPLLKTLRDELMNARKEVCIERAALVTAYIKANEHLSPPLQRAGAVNYYLAKRKAQFFDDSCLAGNTTSKKFGAPVYPEYFGLSIWPELETINTRSSNPQYLSKTDADRLNFEIYPYWMDRSIAEVTRKELNPPAMNLLQKFVYFLSGKASVISHTTPYYEKMLAVGLNGIISEAQAMIDKISLDAPSSEKDKQIEFYTSVKIALNGICLYARNLSTQAITQAKKLSDPILKNNFLKIAEVTAHVPAEPPRTFREAANAILLCHIGVLAENVNMALNPGRLDSLLYPFFEKDYQAGRLSIEEALTISGCLWLKFGDNTNLVPKTAETLFGGAGAVPAVTLGGVDRQGKDAVNDLTYIMLRVTELLKLRDPNVNARYHPKVNSRQYCERVSEVVFHTKAIPAFYNDLTNIETLRNQGVEESDANDYAVVGCVELAGAGREYSASSSVLLNLTAAMDLALYNGRRPYLSDDTLVSFESGDPSAFQSFDEFKKAFYAQLDWLTDQAVSLNEAFGKTYQKYLPTPLLSGLFEGPMDDSKRKDLIFGGAKYNSSGATHVGFADVCDSLNAIQSVIESEEPSSVPLRMKEIVDAVKSNFNNDVNHPLRKRLASSPKYGTEDPRAEENAKELIAFLFRKYQSHTNYRGGKYRPAFWTMTNHAGLGKMGWALPSGRSAHEVFSSGITPTSQSATDLTATFHSVGTLGHLHIPGGYALNIKYTPVSNIPIKEYVQKFSAWIVGFFMQKGMQVQFNLQSYEDLKDAKAHPEKYTDLIVRVSGYSAFYNDLSDAMKEELIERTEYNLTTGKTVPFSAVD